MIRKRKTRRRVRGPLYYVWYNMFRNCRENRYYAGVSVCREWGERSAFVEWAMANGWAPGRMLARIDKDADFSPQNCVFVSFAVFNRLRRCCRRHDRT